MNNCRKCTAADPPIDGGSLFVTTPLSHTAGTLRSHLARIGVGYSEPAPGILAFPLHDGALARFAEGISGVLSLAELRDSRVVVVPDGEDLGPSHLATMQTLAVVVARAAGAWFTDMLASDRFVSHFQPIVSAARPGDVHAYECLLRGLGPDGGLIPPIQLYRAARECDMLFPLDRAARLAAIRSAAAHGLGAGSSRLFINFNPTSVYDPVFCLRTTVSAIAETALRPDQVVFEVVESDQVEDVGHLVRVAEYYRNAGFKVALDDLGSGYGSLNLMGELRPDYVKLDMQLIRGVDGNAYKAGIVEKLLEMASGLGIATVAEGVETEGEWEWVRDHGADYVQGYLFARPASPPPAPRVPADRREAACIAADIRTD